MALKMSEALKTPDPSIARGPSPVLLDDNNEAIIPTVIPASTGFEDFASSTPRTRSAHANASYFDLQPARKVPTEPSLGQDLDRMPAPARSVTAPLARNIRPAFSSKKSSLFGSLNRSSSAAGPIENPNEPFSYAFDPMSSDSDSSSGEDERVHTHKHKHKHVHKHIKRHDPEKFRFNTSNNQNQAGTSQDSQEKKQARRGRSYSRFSIANDYLHTKGRISKRDGRLNISVNETSQNGYVAKTLGQSIKNHLDTSRKINKPNEQQSGDVDGTAKTSSEVASKEDIDQIISSIQNRVPRPRLNIVIMVIGSRGDIQPFVRLASILKEKHGHRVRIASHPVFRDFVEKDAGLEFFSVGGDPSELMAFMVKNPGLIPNLQTIREGEIQRRRNAMAVMFDGFWRACINATDDEGDKANIRMMGDKLPFIADAIIANPPSMAHVHIAEKLGIPLHMMFTFPYSPTQQFPHPLANIRPGKSNVDANYVNFMSYPMVEMMTWQGLGDIVNRFRERTLGLEPVSSLWAPGALYRMRVPYTYMWSPSLVAKPKDWGPEIDIAGFAFLDLASKFEPDKTLQEFLDAGEPPVYIGFGSIVVDDPNAFTDMIFEATKMAGVRALVNKGWGGLGRDNKDTPDHIYMLGNTPHDWLFPRVKAVVHHGGAGTTAIGLKCAKPTMIVPFFGDQPFWGAMVAEAQAGAHECIPYKNLTVEKLAEGIKQCLSDEAQRNVQKIADSIAAEGDGAENAVKSFHRSLNLAGARSIRCSILEDRVAVWQLRHSTLRLSALAATILHQKGKIHLHDLKLIRHNEWNDFDGPGEPITGGIGAFKDTLYDVGEGFGMVPVRIAKHIRKHEAHTRKREERERRRTERKQLKAQQAERAKLKRNPTNANLTEEQSRSSPENAAPTGDQSRRPDAPERVQTTDTLGSVMSIESENISKKMAQEVGRGFEQAGWAIFTLPNDLHVAVARGFHNAPRLWGDSTVRKPLRVTGFKSGFQAAGQELVFGLWDGWTGIVMQPVAEWKDGVTVPQKLTGLGSGIGKGFGGAVVKTVSAIIAPPAYVGQGFLRYTEKKMRGPDTKSFIRRAQTLRGAKDLLSLQTQDDKQQIKKVEIQVLEGWRVYDAIWKSARKEFGMNDHNVVARLRYARTKHRWQEAGMLENVATARKALEAYEQGEAVDAILARRREELRLAQQPRSGVMDQPESPGEQDERPLVTLPDGQVLMSSYAREENGRLKQRSISREALNQIDEEVSSDTTAVEHSGDEGDKSARRGSTVPHSTMPMKGDLVQPKKGKGQMQAYLPSEEDGTSMDKVIESVPRQSMMGV